MKTLHGYFAREMLKAFALTVITLTLLIVLGGGIAQMFTSQGLGADEIGRVFIYLIPVALLWVTPIAALFAATITYGRAASDNEILACKAAGINLHRVLFPSFAAGILAGLVTYAGFNYLIPSLAWKIEDISRRDLPKIVANRFLHGKPLIWAKKVSISAQKCDKIDPVDLPKDLREGYTLLRLTGVAFQEMSDYDLVRIGTADETIIIFDNTERSPKVTVDLQKGRSYDAKRRQYLEFEHQVIGPIDFPVAIQRKVQFENLPTLWEFQRDPMKIPEMEDLMHGMRRDLKEFFLSEIFRDHFQADRGGTGRIELVGPRTTIVLEAFGSRFDQDDARIHLNDVDATVTETGDPLVRKYKAKEATVSLHDGIELYKPMIQIELKDEVIYSVAGDTSEPVRKPKETLPGLGFHDQPEMQKAFDEFEQASVLKPDFALPMATAHLKTRKKVVEKFAEYQSEIRGEIHFRSSLAVAAIGMILIGAMLGIILRTGQVLTAIFISCIPGMLVLISCLVARNFADRPDYGMVAVFVLWGTTAILYAGAGVIGFKVLSR